MKTTDQILLEQAYLRVIAQKEELIGEKVSIKGALAGLAAMGVGAMSSGAHASPVGMSPDDFADRSMIAQTNSPEMDSFTSAKEAYEQAIELIHSGKQLPSSLLQTIASDKDIATRCAHLMVLKKLQLPKQLRAVVGDLDKEMNSSLMGP